MWEAMYGDCKWNITRPIPQLPCWPIWKELTKYMEKHVTHWLIHVDQSDSLSKREILQIEAFLRSIIVQLGIHNMTWVAEIVSIYIDQIMLFSLSYCMSLAFCQAGLSYMLVWKIEFIFRWWGNRGWDNWKGRWTN